MSGQLLAAVLAATAAAAGEAPAGGGPPVFLGGVPVESAPGLAPDGPLAAVVRLNAGAAEKATSLRRWFPAARVRGGAVTLALPGRAPAGTGAPQAAQRGPTWLVDYDRPGAAAFREALRERLGPSPSDEGLARFVDGWITRKSMDRGLDPAAVVAARREGDCTEHAVLLAAAARLAGRASRVVFGVAFVPVDGALRGFGHAWTEVHGAGGWRTVDASPLPAGVRYLPLALLDEGPGRLAAAWGALSPLDVSRVELAPGR